MSIRKICLLSLVVLLLGSSYTLLSGYDLASAHHTRHAHRTQFAWPTRYFAPYSYDAFAQTDLVSLARASGTKFFTLAFISGGQGKNCTALWDSRQPVGSWMRSSIGALQAMGGDVRIAFGGSVGVELANVCTTVRSLQAQYQSVIDTYRVTHLDFDVEGKTLTNTSANERRNEAIAGLQARAKAAGRRLDISYTLPVEVTGLTYSGINLLRDAIQDGVNIAAVNIMTMDYYSKSAPGDQMGQNAIGAANSVYNQLRALYPSRTASQIWAMIGMTPMIGVNDDHAEVFTLQDAQTVLNFAEQQHMILLSFWDVEHDRQCSGNESAPHSCTGVRQQAYQYDQTFAAFTAGEPAQAEQNPN